MEAIGKILVRGPNWVGDHVLAIPFYRELRRLYPNARVSLLIGEACAGLPIPVFFEEIIPLSVVERKRPRKIAKRLVGKSFDLAITLPASFSSAASLWLAGIPERVGFAAGGSQFFLTASLRWSGRESRRHKRDLYLELLSWLSGRSCRDEEGPTVSRDRREPRIILAPGASIPLREWPFFPELVPRLRATFPTYQLTVVGANSDRKWSSILGRVGGGALEDRIGQTSLAELTCLIRESSVVVANDSGAAHVSATLAGTPTVILFGPGDPAFVAPRGQVESVHVEGLSCRPCERATCRAPYGYQRCLRDLPVEAVLRAVERVLSFSKPPG